MFCSLHLIAKMQKQLPVFVKENHLIFVKLIRQLVGTVSNEHTQKLPKLLLSLLFFSFPPSAPQ